MSISPIQSPRQGSKYPARRTMLVGDRISACTVYVLDYSVQFTGRRSEIHFSSHGLAQLPEHACAQIKSVIINYSYNYCLQQQDLDNLLLNKPSSLALKAWLPLSHRSECIHIMQNDTGSDPRWGWFGSGAETTCSA